MSRTRQPVAPPTRLRLVMAIALTMLALMMPGPAPAVALPLDAIAATHAMAGSVSTHIVTTTADSGPGSLRAAMLAANSNPDPSRVTVDPALLASGSAVITLDTPLPMITGPTELTGGSLSTRSIIDGSRVLTGHGFAVAAPTLIDGWEIRDFPDIGVSLAASADGSVVRNSVITGNSQGIVVGAPRTLIGGHDVDEGNVVVDNGNIGINIAADATEAVLQGNHIGTDPAGTADIGNGFGVVTASSGGLFGAESMPGPGAVSDANARAMNVIAGNRLDGVRVIGDASGNRMAGNHIGRTADGALLPNEALGINLAPGMEEGRFLPTPNDEYRLDADTGPNGLQNYPTLEISAANRVRAVLVSKPNTTFTIDLFVSPSCDRLGVGESGEWVDSRQNSTNAAGVWVMTSPVQVPSGQMVTATATGAEGTSEFSVCVAAV